MPWLRVDRRRVYAVGGSMGGQETLLLVGQHPQLLAGAVVFDSVTNFYTRYRDFALIRNGRRLQALARLEVGGTPSSRTREYVLRSPTHWVREVAGAGCRYSCGGATQTRSSSASSASRGISTRSFAVCGRAGASRP